MLQQRSKTSKLRKSFAIIIVGCILVIFFVSFEDIRAKIRDEKRKGDLREVVKALEIYYSKYNFYPESSDDDWNGWDATFEPGGHPYRFITPLEEERILLKGPVDPYNDSIYFYRYRKFPAGSFGCRRPFYVLQIVNFETAQDDHGWGECPERNFVEELPNGFTVMKFD